MRDKASYVGSNHGDTPFFKRGKAEKACKRNGDAVLSPNGWKSARITTPAPV